MISGTVRARHPRPKPNEKICCTFDGHRPIVGHHGLEQDLAKFLFLKMGENLRSISDHRMGFYVFLIDFGRGWRAPTASGLLIKSRSY